MISLAALALKRAKLYQFRTDTYIRSLYLCAELHMEHAFARDEYTSAWKISRPQTPVRHLFEFLHDLGMFWAFSPSDVIVDTWISKDSVKSNR